MFEDYARLPDRAGIRYEVIRGHLYMSPAPKPKHQMALLNLAAMMREHVKRHKLGMVFVAPTDVIMADVATPVQPDILFIAKANESIVNEDNIKGVPDLLIEVLSPSRPQYDRDVKFKAYQDVRVLEYWIVDPDAKTIEVNVRREDMLLAMPLFHVRETLMSEVLPGFTPLVDEVFEK